MLAEIELDVLHFLDRAALEGLQMHSRYLRDFVNHNRRSFPLHRIYEIDVTDGNVYVQLLEEGERVLLGPEGLFLHANNAFVHRLALSFDRERLLPLYYLHANASELQCHIGALFVEASDEEIDFALVDFLGICLKPQVYEASTDGELCEEQAMLFTRNALRQHITHLVYWLSHDPAPDCIFPELFGAAVVETCAIATSVDPHLWICKYMKLFEMAELRTHIVRSVTLLHTRIGEGSPLRLDVELLGRPRRTEVCRPHNAFVEQWLRAQDESLRENGCTVIEPTVAKLAVLENAKAARKLEVLVWALEEWRERMQFSLHYVYVLQVVDM